MLTIGQMSKACSVTVKTLHHYDKIGLFKPEYTDEFTGYRYYTEQQIKVMLLIDRYKRYGFSLSEIQKLLETEEFDPAYNDTELGVIINNRDKADRILPSRLCAVTTHIGPYSSLPDAYGKIVAWTKAQGYQMADAPYEIYRKTAFNGLSPEEWETEIFFPVKK